MICTRVQSVFASSSALPQRAGACCSRRDLSAPRFWRCRTGAAVGRGNAAFSTASGESDSYAVNKCRALHYLQNNDSAFRAELKRAQFVVFYDRQPLLERRNDGARTQNSDLDRKVKLVPPHAYTLRSVPYENLKSIADQHGFPLGHENVALLDVAPMQGHTNDVFEEWQPVVALGLKNSHMRTGFGKAIPHQTLADELKGEFMDLRRAYFLIHDQTVASLMAKAQALLRWSNVYKFCPKCASPLVIKASKSSADCPSCKQVYYPTISPVSITLISDPSNQHLLLVRQPRQVPGVYTAVAGFSETGESLEETSKRECAEEVGLDVADVRYTNLSKCWPFPQNSLMCAFRATADMAQKVSIDKSELEDGRWFTRDEVNRAFLATTSEPGFFNLDFSKVGEGEFRFVPPYGTVAHELIKAWLLEETEKTH